MNKEFILNNKDFKTPSCPDIVEKKLLNHMYQKKFILRTSLVTKVSTLAAFVLIAGYFVINHKTDHQISTIEPIVVQSPQIRQDINNNIEETINELDEMIAILDDDSLREI